jgi:hypothetical protein
MDKSNSIACVLSKQEALEYAKETMNNLLAKTKQKEMKDLIHYVFNFIN